MMNLFASFATAWRFALAAALSIGAAVNVFAQAAPGNPDVQALVAEIRN